MAGFSLTGIDPSSPKPGIVREIKFARGESLGAGASRDVVLIGNKIAGTSLTADAIHPDPIGSEGEVVSLAGAGSELHLMYRAFKAAAPQQANIYLACVAEHASGTSATVTLTLASGPASANTTLRIKALGEVLDVPVANGDTATVVGDALALAINKQTHWPFSAANSTGTVTLTSKNVGPRHKHSLNKLSASFLVSASMTVTKGSVSGGGTADDQSNIILALANKTFYYQVNGRDSKVTGVAVSATDNGIGEHSASIAAQALPAVGKDQIMICAALGSNGEAVTDAVALNTPLAVLVWAGDNQQWTAGMLAAHLCAIKRAKEIAHPGANLTNYGLEAGEICAVPKPVAAADEPIDSEIVVGLNGGVTPIAFSQSGKPYVVRQITTYGGIDMGDPGETGASADYRVREGHIPSCMHYAWQQIYSLYKAQAQDFVADDPAAGEKPLQGVTYPRDVKALITKVINDLTGPAFPGGPVLDPSYKDSMINSISVVRLTDGISARVALIAVKHNNKGQFLIEEASAGY